MDKHLKIAESLTTILDNQFKIGSFSFGLDPLLDFIPGLGDVLGLLLSGYIIWVAKRMKVPSSEINKMVRNVSLDFVLGIVPFLGFITDAFYKANVKNIAILRKYKDRQIVEGEILTP